MKLFTSLWLITMLGLIVIGIDPNVLCRQVDLVIYPSVVEVWPGQTAFFAITSKDAYAGMMRLSLSIPFQTFSKIEPDAIMSGDVAILSIVAPPNAPQDYSIQVRGIGLNFNASATAVLRVVPITGLAFTIEPNMAKAGMENIFDVYFSLSEAQIYLTVIEMPGGLPLFSVFCKERTKVAVTPSVNAIELVFTATTPDERQYFQVLKVEGGVLRVINTTTTIPLGFGVFVGLMSALLLLVLGILVLILYKRQLGLRSVKKVGVAATKYMEGVCILCGRSITTRFCPYCGAEQARL